MSDPLSTECAYCGSPDVIDDAWWCQRRECWQAYDDECLEVLAYEDRTPLTRSKARRDVVKTHAFVWGIPYGQMIGAMERLVVWS